MLLTACSRSPERVEGDAVKEGIRKLRAADAADDAGRKALVAKLEALPARLPEAQRARDACVEAYKSLLEARALRAKAGAAADAGTPLDGLAGLLDAQAELAKANEAMPRCDTASTELTLALRR